MVVRKPTFFKRVKKSIVIAGLLLPATILPVKKVRAEDLNRILSKPGSRVELNYKSERVTPVSGINSFSFTVPQKNLSKNLHGVSLLLGGRTVFTNFNPNSKVPITNASQAVGVLASAEKEFDWNNTNAIKVRAVLDPQLMDLFGRGYKGGFGWGLNLKGGHVFHPMEDTGIIRMVGYLRVKKEPVGESYERVGIQFNPNDIRLGKSTVDIHLEKNSVYGSALEGSFGSNLVNLKKVKINADVGFRVYPSNQAAPVVGIGIGGIKFFGKKVNLDFRAAGGVPSTGVGEKFEGGLVFMNSSDESAPRRGEFFNHYSMRKEQVR